MIQIRKMLLLVSFLFLFVPFQMVHAETLEDQLNNLIGPKNQYNTMLSPVYLKTNTTDEYISPQSGDLTITQTDFVLPGRNGLDLEIKRIYKSGISNVQEMKVKYVRGAWVDYVYSDAKTSSFYEDRYNIGIGMRFSFPSIEVKKNSDGTSHKFLHTDSGDVYRLKPYTVNGILTYIVEGQTIKDVIVRESNEFNNGQSDGASKYVMTGKDGKKTFFAEDGRVLGIVDRYGNTIKFEYSTFSYTIDGTTINKRLISKITDTIGRVVTIQYKEDPNFTVGSIVNQNYSAEERYKTSQNPNNINSGDLQGKFQVIINLPGNKKMVYDKTAVLVSPSKHVMRTRLQRVFDVDNKPKYHFWYEQPELGFTFTNGKTYSAYNRYENLVQIDYCKINRLDRYVYNTYTKQLNEGSMQYRKIFAQQDLIKKGFDTTQAKFPDKFIVEVKDKLNYAYTNEPDGFGVLDYKEFDDFYLRNTYRYYTELKDIKGNTVKYSYDGLHQLINTEEQGADYKEVVTSEHDEMKLVKLKKRVISQVVNGQVTGTPVHKIENFRYDEYGNLTNYTGPDAQRDENGYPVNTERTVIYSYAYDKYHVLTSKTWKRDENTNSQIIYSVDNKGNVLKETKVTASGDSSQWIVTDFLYDGYGNMTRKEVKSGNQSFITNYAYGVDADGTDHKGAYLTKEYTYWKGIETAKKYTYDFHTGNLTGEIDPKGNRTSYQYDVLNRVLIVTNPDDGTKEFVYMESPFANLKIQYTDPEKHQFLYEYDILGNQVKSSVYDNQQWNVLTTFEYDAKGNKTKEMNANGHSIRYEYDSKYRLTSKSYFEKDTAFKGSLKVEYAVGYDSETPLLVKITDTEGYIKKYHYDILDRLVKEEVTPDNVNFYATTHTYDYVGNKLTTTDFRNNTNRFVYDNLNRLIKKIDPLGNETEYAYNALNKLAQTIEPGGKVTKNSYDELGRVEERKIYKQDNPDYAYILYVYDPAGNVVNLKQGEVTGGVNHLSKDVNNQYDKMNNLTAEYGRIDETRTSHVTHAYDKKGNKIRAVNYINTEGSKFLDYQFVYDYDGRIIEESGAYKQSDGQGGFTVQSQFRNKNQYDYAGNVMNRQSLNNSGNYDTSTYVYNYRNKVVEEKLPYLNNESFKTIKHDYDKMGNLLAETRIVKGVAETVSYRYDGLGRKLMEIDPLGNSTRFKYDANGNVIKKIDPRYIHLTVDQAPGIEFEYDALNRLIKTVAFDGSNREVINYKEYDQRGNLAKNVEGEGFNAAQPDQSYGNVYVYDIFDHMITYISAQTFADNMKNGTQYHTRKYMYDSLGNVLSEEDGLGNKIQYVYYLNGKLKEKIDPDGYKESYDYDLTGEMMTVKTDRAGYVTKIFNTVFVKPYRIEYPDNSFETFIYSPKGELTESRDQEGNAKYFGYDPSGNQIFKKEFIKADSSYTSYKLVKNGYDEANRLISMETFLYKEPKSGLDAVTVSAGDKVEFVYDKAGRQTKVSGPFGREALNEYDRAGNLITKKEKVYDGEYDVKRFTYNFRSQLVSESLLVKTSDVEIQYLAGASYDQTYYDRALATTSHGYNKNGKISSKKDPYGNITRFDYDLDNRLTKKTDPLQAATTYRYDLNDNLLEEINAKGVSTSYEYDNLNRLIRKKTPAADGGVAVTRYIYDVLGNLIKNISPEDYDPDKDVPPLAGAMLGIAYTYDRMNRRVSTISPDGKVMEYVVYDKNGRVRKVIDGLRFTGDITTSKGTVHEYDGLGQVVKQTDTLGYSTIFEYNVLGNLTKRVDAKGNITVQNFNPDNTLRSVTFADGGTVAYTYDKLGRKTGETNQLGNTTTYIYNVFGKLKETRDPYNYTTVSKYDLNGNLVSNKDKRGSVSLFKYDGNNRLVEKKIPLELDGSSNIVYAVESYIYDELGNLLRKSVTKSKDASFKRETSYTYYDNNLLQTESNNGGFYIRYEYDKNGNRTKLEKLRDVDAYDIEMFEYDKLNRMVKHIRLADEEDVYQSGFTNLENLRDSEYPGKIRMIIGYEYDVLGNKTKEIDPRSYMYLPEDTLNREKYTVTFTYDELNRLDKVIRKHDETDVYKQFSYDEVGNKITERNERGYVTHYDYDKMNRLFSITDPRENTFSYQYDLAGNKTGERNAKGYAMTYGYDKLNRLETIKDPYNVVIRKNVYDANGNIVKVIDAKGYLSANNDQDRYGTTHVYDLANRLVKIIDPEVAAVGGANTFTVKYEYNPVGQKTKETDALGNTHVYEYNPAGNLLSVTDPLGVKTSYHYDKAGNKSYMLDGRGKITRYHYGSFGWLREVINADNKYIRYRYDLAGNVTQKIDQKGYHTEYTYDNRSLLLSKEVKETGDSIRYSYDETGNRIAMTDESGNSTYSYDERNLLLQINKGGIMQIRYTYDEIGNIETITDKNGATTGYTYDKSSRMETVTYNGTTTYLYDENGNRKAVIYPGGVSEEYSYDKNNKLLTLTNKKPDGSTISGYSYTYDLRGLQETKTDEFGTTVYAYDEVGRIKKVDAPGKTTVYSYDNAGNRQSMMETYTSPQPSGFIEQTSQKQVQFKIKKSEYVYSNTNQLLKLVETMYDEAGVEVLEKTVDYLYDENGNEVSEKNSYISPHTIKMRQSTGANPHGDGVTGELNLLLEKVTNTYDGFNQLKTAVKIKGGERFTVSYVYNGDGLRTKKTVLSSKEGNTPKVTNYLYDRQHVILETDGSDRTLVRYVRGVNYIARIDGSGKTSYFLYNGHGDVVQTVSASGEVENRYDYDIFGNPILTMEVYANSIRYAGEFFDTETGLYYLRARYYNPYIGRFISEDSYWGEDSNPLSLNLYTYTENDPINFIDPTGHWKQGDENLSQSDKRKIKALTDAYNSADNEKLKQDIGRQADEIRNQAKYKTNEPVERKKSGTNNSDSFSREANKIIAEKGYISAEDWKKLSENYNRRSKGTNDSVKYRNQDIIQSSKTVIEDIIEYAENNFDHRMGSREWAKEVEYMSKESGNSQTLKFVIQDSEKHQSEYIDIKNNDKNSFETYFNTVNKLLSKNDSHLSDKDVKFLLPVYTDYLSKKTSSYNGRMGLVQDFYNRYRGKDGQNYGEDIKQFMEWEFESGRLGNEELKGGSEYWKIANGYFIYDMYLSEFYKNAGRTDLAKGDLKKWIKFMEEPTQPNAWISHNASINTVTYKLWDASFIQATEEPSEQAFIWSVIIRVNAVSLPSVSTELLPDDIQNKIPEGWLFNTQEGNIGSHIRGEQWNGVTQYPHRYPATWDDRATYPSFIKSDTWRGLFENK